MRKATTILSVLCPVTGGATEGRWNCCLGEERVEMSSRKRKMRVTCEYCPWDWKTEICRVKFLFHGFLCVPLVSCNLCLIITLIQINTLFFEQITTLKNRSWVKLKITLVILEIWQDSSMFIIKLWIVLFLKV